MRHVFEQSVRKKLEYELTKIISILLVKRLLEKLNNMFMSPAYREEKTSQHCTASVD